MPDSCSQDAWLWLSAAATCSRPLPACLPVLWVNGSDLSGETAHEDKILLLLMGNSWDGICLPGKVIFLWAMPLISPLPFLCFPAHGKLCRESANVSSPPTWPSCLGSFFDPLTSTVLLFIYLLPRFCFNSWAEACVNVLRSIHPPGDIMKTKVSSELYIFDRFFLLTIPNFKPGTFFFVFHCHVALYSFPKRNCLFKKTQPTL